MLIYVLLGVLILLSVINTIISIGSAYNVANLIEFQKMILDREEESNLRNIPQSYKDAAVRTTNSPSNMKIMHFDN